MTTPTQPVSPASSGRMTDDEADALLREYESAHLTKTLIAERMSGAIGSVVQALNPPYWDADKRYWAAYNQLRARLTSLPHQTTP